MNKKISGVLAVLAIVVPGAVFAQDAKSLRETRENTVKEIKETRENARKEIKETREEVQKQRIDAVKEVKTQRENLRNNSSMTEDEKMEERKEIKENWDKKRDELKTKREEGIKKIESIRAETKNKVQEKREALKEDLKKIKNEKKIERIVNIDGKLEKINEERTSSFLINLDKMDSTLGKITARMEGAKAEGKDVSSVSQAVDSAKVAITSSRSAVEVQAAKVYKITVSTENNLKTDVGESVKGLQNDLNQVRETVKTAHESVKKAAVLLGQILGASVSSTSVSSASSSVPASN